MTVDRTKYFQVRGQKKLYKVIKDDASGEDVLVPQGLSPDVRLRFECLVQSDAEQFATAVYKREGVICTIDEIRRVTT